MFAVLESQVLAPNLHMLTLEAPEVARQAQAGQFVILRAEEDGERIPLSLADWDVSKGTITVVIVNVGKTTDRLTRLKTGQAVPTVAGPLGRPLKIEPVKAVCLVGGCYGVGSIYPLARAYRRQGSRVLIVVEGKSGFAFYWEEKLRSLADKIVYITRDGTRGARGHIDLLPRAIEASGEPVEKVIANGCNHLLSEVCAATQPLGLPTQVCLNTLMIDGTGMCGVCRVTVGGQMKFACVDGPYFDGHAVDWQELFQRRQSYLREEVQSLRSSAGMEECL